MSRSVAARITGSDVVVAVGIAAVVAYFGLLAWATGAWGYDRWMVLVLAPILVAVGAAVVVAVTRHDERPLTELILVALVLKLAASFVRYFVAFELYGSGDALRYDEAGAEIADAFHRGDMTLGSLLSLGRGTAFMDDITGVLYTVMGPSQLGGFLVYSWVGFWGLFLFHRAALIGFPEADQRRYALLLFFLPSLLFWPSSIGKEAVMLLSLGLCAYGSARLLERRSMGWLVLLAGLGLGYLVRPHVPFVVLASLAVAVVFRQRRGRAPVFGPLGRIVTIVVLMVGMAFVLSETVDRVLPQRDEGVVVSVDVGTLGELLDRAESGTSDGGSEIDRPTPNTPFEYPGAAFTVLFRPTIFEADSAGHTVAALETTLVLALAVFGWRRWRTLPSVVFRRPYVLMCLVFTGIFTFAWSSFANLGALARQRVQVWPFVLLLLALPLVVRDPPRERRPIGGAARRPLSQPRQEQ
jgi:hypothetical protein